MNNDTGSFLARYGRQLLNQGYPIVPISPGSKRPGYKDWQHTRADEAQLNRWLRNGYAEGGVGVLTRNYPAVDLDVSNAEIVAQLIEWCRSNIAPTLQRVGMPPRTLLAYRTAEPFRKVSSKIYEDATGKEHKVEILGDGQQYVAYAIHPDLHRPYVWTTRCGLADLKPDQLPIITLEQAQRLVRYFESIVPFDWKVVTPK